MQIALSTDIIAGFCGETEAQHHETLDLIEQVGYDQAFLFAYSSRSQTYAARHLEVGANSLLAQKSDVYQMMVCFDSPMCPVASSVLREHAAWHVD